jgi:hypothetical protein
LLIWEEEINLKIIMKITLCGSIVFHNEALSIKKELEKLGCEVKLWPIRIKDNDGNPIPIQEYYKIRKKASNDERWVWNRKAEAIENHFNKVAWSDAILVLNYEKNNVKSYIGGNTLMEIGIAFYLKKKIYLLNEVPELPYKEEILGVKPIILNNDLSKIEKLS